MKIIIIRLTNLIVNMDKSIVKYVPPKQIYDAIDILFSVEHIISLFINHDTNFINLMFCIDKEKQKTIIVYIQSIINLHIEFIETLLDDYDISDENKFKFFLLLLCVYDTFYISSYCDYFTKLLEQLKEITTNELNFVLENMKMIREQCSCNFGKIFTLITFKCNNKIEFASNVFIYFDTYGTITDYIEYNINVNFTYHDFDSKPLAFYKYDYNHPFYDDYVYSQLIGHNILLRTIMKLCILYQLYDLYNTIILPIKNTFTNINDIKVCEKIEENRLQQYRKQCEDEIRFYNMNLG